MVTGEETVRIDGLTAEGAGVARLPNGMAVFVPRSLPGELCRVRVEHVGRRAAHAALLEVLEASPHRIDPDCPHFGVCGGCAFRHMDYAGECGAKRSRVEETLRRIGGADVRLEAFLAAEETERYRNKAQYPVGPAGPGFFRAGSHAVVPVSDCRLLPEAVNAAACAVEKWMVRYGVPAYDEGTGTGLLRHIYARHSKAGETLVCLVTAGTSLPRRDALCQMLRAAVPGLVGVVQNVNRERTNVILGSAYRAVWGADHLMDELCGKTFRLSVPSFFQVNRKQTERLYERVLAYAALTGEETVLDLYCGIGTITLCLAERAKTAVGAEIVPAAVRDAEENARRNGVGNVRFLCADAAEAAAHLAGEGLAPDVVVVDPPRKGLSEDVVRIIAEMGPRRVVYVSCDPATLARDVARFSKLGYSVGAATAVDLFPRTAHVETVCLLSKLNSGHHIEVELNLDELDLTTAEGKATYDEIKAYVLENSGFNVSSLYIAQVKEKMGIKERDNYNLSENEDAKVPQSPPGKEKAIIEALKHFGTI